ncbi:MAG: cysteine desulfurase [Chitinophagales bacterium]|nr:cysteine desulfurase [Chitinophagales bacterium]
MHSTILTKQFDVQAIREDFPILKIKVHNKPLVYFDNAASTQKPQSVIDKITEVYTSQYANIHRGVHHLSQLGTGLYEETRKTVQNFIHAQSEKEIIYTKGTTDGINLLAYAWSAAYLKSGDEILITALEHHSNIIPWQLACQRHGAILKVVPVQDDGSILIEDVKKNLTEKTKLFAFTHVSNALGTINPIADFVEAAKSVGAHTLIDCAQSIQHIPVDVQAFGCDFLAFSGHKLYGPTGIGILYGKEKLLEEIPPFQGGGDMIKDVKFEKTSYNELPFKFEAGTPHITGAIALKQAIDYVQNIGIELIHAHEDEVLRYATTQILQIDGVRIIGQAPHKTSVLSFLIDGTHPYDIGVLLDQQGIAVRTGHHCAQPIMDQYCIPGTCRASFAVYNTLEEVDIFIAGLKKATKMLL